MGSKDFPPESTDFPSFARSEDWYDLKVFPSQGMITAPLSYEAHRSSVAATLKRLGITSHAITHVFRGSSARMADLAGAGEESIRRGGRWDHSALINHYITHLPRAMMRVSAGFAPDAGTYFIARDVPVPESLASKIFPQAAIWCVAPAACRPRLT